MWIPKLEDGLLNLFFSQQIRVEFRDGFCKSSSVNENNVFLNYLKNSVFIESCPILFGRHETIHWECVKTEKVHRKLALPDLPVGQVSYVAVCKNGLLHILYYDYARALPVVLTAHLRACVHIRPLPQGLYTNCQFAINQFSGDK